jgi:hypothetical protein
MPYEKARCCRIMPRKSWYGVLIKHAFFCTDNRAFKRQAHRSGSLAIRSAQQCIAKIDLHRQHIARQDHKLFRIGRCGNRRLLKKPPDKSHHQFPALLLQIAASPQSVNSFKRILLDSSQMRISLEPAVNVGKFCLGLPNGEPPIPGTLG